jgi:hypothetical protein
MCRERRSTTAPPARTKSRRSSSLSTRVVASHGVRVYQHANAALITLRALMKIVRIELVFHRS